MTDQPTPDALSEAVERLTKLIESRTHFFDTDDIALVLAALSTAQGRIGELQADFEDCNLHRAHAESALATHKAEIERLRAALDPHSSDCATHNEPAYPNGPCDCWISKAKELYASQFTDSEDHERFFSWYGAELLAVVKQCDDARAALASPDGPGEGDEEDFGPCECDGR